MHDDPRIVTLRAMLFLLPLEQKELLARRLHDQLYRPATAREHRLAELGYLAWLLDETPQPPDRLPLIERRSYEARRFRDCPTAPRAAALVHRYGSWSRACWAAWGLLPDGRNAWGGQPWWSNRPANSYGAEDCVRAVKACALSLDRLPTSTDYQTWARARRRASRNRGRQNEEPSINVVLRILAPRRRERNGWRMVLSRVFQAP